MTMTAFKLSASEALLCDVLADLEPKARKDAARRFIEELGDEKAFSLAQANGVSSVVAHALMEAYGAEDVPAHWLRVHEENFKRISAYLAELDRVAAILAGQDIQLVALKNGGIARGIYPCPGCCPMGDLDVLVEKSHFRRAHQILLAEGYLLSIKPPLALEDFEAAEKTGVAEYKKLLNSQWELELELHWRSATGRWIRSDQEPSTEELMACSIPILGTAVRLLSPEDNLLQVTLHTAKHTYVRAPGFRLHLDVERIVRAYPDLDWDVFLKRVKNLQVKTAVYFSLAIPRELFRTPIPDRVLVQLRPSFRKERLIIGRLKRVGLFNPNERKFGKIGYVLFNALLYDDLKGLLRSIFPKRNAMITRYGSLSTQPLLMFYLRRLMDLAFRRVNT